MTDLPVEQDGKVLCLACAEEGNPRYFEMISLYHLIKIHPDKFPDSKIAFKTYKERYPNWKIGGKGGRRKEFKNSKLSDDISPEKWSEIKSKQLFEELEKIKKTLKSEIECPHCGETFVIPFSPDEERKIIADQNKIIKEVAPSRSFREPSKKTKKNINPQQEEAMAGIIPLLEKLKINNLKEIDGRVSKCLN